MYDAGHEIAAHTQNHVSLLRAPRSKVESEVVGARDILAGWLGVAKTKIRGSRCAREERPARGGAFSEGRGLWVGGEGGLLRGAACTPRRRLACWAPWSTRQPPYPAPCPGRPTLRQGPPTFRRCRTLGLSTTAALGVRLKGGGGVTTHEPPLPDGASMHPPPTLPPPPPLLSAATTGAQAALPRPTPAPGPTTWGVGSRPTAPGLGGSTALAPTPSCGSCRSSCSRCVRERGRRRGKRAV